MLPRNSETFRPSVWCTLWKFEDFSVTQILREINFVESRSAETAIFANFDNFRDLNSVHLVNSSLQKVQKSVKSKFRASKHVKMADFALQELSKLISRKIWVTEKSWYFHTVWYQFATKLGDICPSVLCQFATKFGDLSPKCLVPLFTQVFCANLPRN